MRAYVCAWVLLVLVFNQLLLIYFFTRSDGNRGPDTAQSPPSAGQHGSTAAEDPNKRTAGAVPSPAKQRSSIRLYQTPDPLAGERLASAPIGRKPVMCHPEVCENAQCDESCGQVPKVISECKGSECQHEHPQLIYKVELSYPAFVMPMPAFVHPEIERRFLNVSVVKGTYTKEHGDCPSPFARPGENRCNIIGNFDSSKELFFTHKRYIYGELTIIKDGIWRGQPDDSFGKWQCWEESDYKWITNSKEGINAARSFKKAVVMLTPQTGGAYYQHFIDRGWSKLIQAWDLINEDPEVKILVSPSYLKHPNVEQLWDRFGLKDRLVYVKASEPVHAEEMIFPCKATHYHPLVYQRAQRYLGINPDVPLDKRKKIVYFTRKNKSRPVVNEDELLAGVRQWMKDNNRPEELIVFQHGEWSDRFNEMIEFFNYEVVAVFGPHGGAFYNVLYTARNTIVIEFFPISMKNDAYRWPECIWWPSHFLGLRYYQLPIQTRTASVQVEPYLVTDILQQALPR